MKYVIFLALILIGQPSIAADRVDFNREVRRILAEHCWQCHGPDENARQAGLRLDTRDKALQPAESGSIAIVPHDTKHSEMIDRISAADEDIRMPPREFGKPLSSGQIETLKRWIHQGAEYQQHWAFEPLTKPRIPSYKDVSNPIDAFVGIELENKDLSFSPRANRETLMRRISFALTGLPPTLNDLDRVDESISQFVDRLLASPQFGEQLAVGWLDAARYADTNGYFGDKPRQMWLWHDWVIEAFNSNMPFDQFTVEQLAGDLLPNASMDQRIATGFNRNHMANNETGIIDEEYRVEYVADRVDTTLTTWMAMTAGCAQCHDHKFDPISQREYYGLFAFFNNVPEKGLITADNPPPLLSVLKPKQERRLAKLKAEASTASQTFQLLRPGIDTRIAHWESDAEAELPSSPAKHVLLHEPFEGRLIQGTRPEGTDFEFPSGVRGLSAKFDATQHAEREIPEFNANAPWSIGFWVKPDGTLSCLLSKIEPIGTRRGLEFLLQKGSLGINLVDQWGAHTIEVSTPPIVTSRIWHHVVVVYDGSRTADGLKVLVNGKPTELSIHRDTLTGSFENREPFRIGRRDAGLGYYGLFDELRILQRSVNDQEVANWFRGERIRGIFATDPKSRSPRDHEFLLEDFLRQQGDPEVRDAYRRMMDTRDTEKSFRAKIPTTLVMQELPEPRTTHVLIRGEYDQPGEIVVPTVPAAIAAMPKDVPANRLGFAQWVVSNENPLTARVTVNRIWELCFGAGLVRTMNDFGTQGEPPTHPKLLDWLAVTFRESDWDIKNIMRLIVTSRTFQQDSSFTNEAARDPTNRFLARGPSFRLSAEMIRDQALAASGLLCRQLGGPSVKPYQPPGLWEEVSYNGAESYIPDTGDKRWRRSVYTYIKRQSPPPAFLTFDGTTREKCTIQRPRTNTPLQSLVLLNDPTYVEAAHTLAQIVLAEESDDPLRLHQVFRRVLSRLPDQDEENVAMRFLARQKLRFRNDSEAAEALLAGEPELPNDQPDLEERAAWTVLSQTVLNLDEAIRQR